MDELHFEKIQIPTGRVIDVFEALEMQTIWHQPQKDMYVIFQQEVKEDRQYCYWYNGEVATIILNNTLIIKLNALSTIFYNTSNSNPIEKEGSPIWQIDIYTMKDCTDLASKIKQQLLNVNYYIDKIKGSFELASHDFKNALSEIYSHINTLLEINN